MYFLLHLHQSKFKRKYFQVIKTSNKIDILNVCLDKHTGN